MDLQNIGDLYIIPMKIRRPGALSVLKFPVGEIHPDQQSSRCNPPPAQADPGSHPVRPGLF